ncbi:MAG TPA: biotin carboxylase N-terminal domain-containing protein [Candidatus Limnocylindria bacterium]|nr:biotin carboxylase N-terminal domain-containing protein [Candidatus Limnocylindria bacterium]
MDDGTLTPRQAADELGVTVRTVQRWVAAGRLPARRVGGRLRLSRSSLAAMRAEGAAVAGRPLRRLLIANRGEIAVRVARTAAAMGVEVVAIHTREDRPPTGVDRTFQVPSYLDAEAVVAAAVEAGAEAVHPGYGFLAENPAFVHAVTAAGLRWVGPPADAIAAMGDKAAARTTAAAHGVAVLPGYDGPDQDDATLIAAAHRIGLPLLVKPSAGGGGKGMHLVRGADELPDALAAARREAERAFGDARLILERLLDGARHVEVQVLFDAEGAGVHLGERDCSAQRRNQKIVEEAPGPAVDAALRERMGQAALQVARAVGYVSAGTVEFLLDDAGQFYFLEMNTRLQVEHPVTEAVTGRDLVADQLRIAAGEPLGFTQRAVQLSGHAVEARLYAEDAENGFLPATGSVVHLRWPEGVRVDTALRPGDEVTDRYDPMLAKLIAHGRSRAEALERLTAALGETEVLGVRTNLRFLRWLLDQPVMRGGEMRTDTVGAMALPAPPSPSDAAWRAVAAAAVAGGLAPDGAWGGGWRLNQTPSLRLEHGGETRSVVVARDPTSAIDLPLASVPTTRTLHLGVEGQSLEFRLADAPTVEEAALRASVIGQEGAVLAAPMPGRVIAVRVAEGATVGEREPVVILEAMKMEHAVLSPLAGRVARLAVVEGQQVQRGDVLAEVSA